MVLFFLAFGILFYISVTFRTSVLHPVAFSFYSLRDVFFYFFHLRWRECFTGELIAYCGLFGKGKTLSAVHHVCTVYRKYNNKKVYDTHRKKWVTQKIVILSNVTLKNVPFMDFISLDQIIEFSKIQQNLDLQNDTLTCLFVLGDEFSVQMNSRNFKSNIDALFLNTLLTCRHYHITLIYTAQRFNHVDALLRQVTSYVYQCEKIWRIQTLKKYDAWDLENANSPTNVKALSRSGWFVRNRDFAAYDTLACVGNLEKSVRSGDMLSTQDILAIQNFQPSDMDSVRHKSFKYRKRVKKSS